MMVNSVSGVRFGNTAETGSTNILERPGAFTKPAQETKADTVTVSNETKKSSTGKKVLTVAGIALAIAAALVVGNKTNFLKVLGETDLAGAGILQKTKHYLGKAGEFIGKYTYDPIAKLFAKKNPAA